MDRLMKVAEVSEVLGISPNTLRAWIWGRRELGRYAIKCGRSIRFRQQDVYRYIEENRLVKDGP